jgi:hypothetical protein
MWGRNIKLILAVLILTTINKCAVLLMTHYNIAPPLIYEKIGIVLGLSTHKENTIMSDVYGYFIILLLLLVD